VCWRWETNKRRARRGYGNRHACAAPTLAVQPCRRIAEAGNVASAVHRAWYSTGEGRRESRLPECAVGKHQAEMLNRESPNALSG